MTAGAFVTVAGLIMRLGARITAGSAFTHEIAHTKLETHKLVTNGLYRCERFGARVSGRLVLTLYVRFVRHPGYCGWYFFVIGTQLMLCNFISAAGFALVAWQFFSVRIRCVRSSDSVFRVLMLSVVLLQVRRRQAYRILWK